MVINIRILRTFTKMQEWSGKDNILSYHKNFNIWLFFYSKT